MKHFRITIAAVLFAFLLGAAAAQTPPMRDIFLPLVTNGQASVCDGKAPLSDTDVGSLSAMRDADGRYIVALQDRHDGSRAHVMQHVGDHLEELDDPVLATALAGVPTFLPNDAKVGALALVPGLAGEKDRLYYVQRERDDTPNEGPYELWCMEF